MTTHVYSNTRLIRKDEISLWVSVSGQVARPLCRTQFLDKNRVHSRVKDNLVTLTRWDKVTEVWILTGTPTTEYTTTPMSVQQLVYDNAVDCALEAHGNMFCN